MAKRAFIATFAALGFFSTMPRAMAHPQLKGSVPAADVSTASPQEIRLIFNEGLIAKLSGIDLKDQSGKQIATEQAVIDPNDTKQLIIRLRSPLTAGYYTVEWHAVSEDTHRVKGSYSFQVEP
jgi:copper resistance protein C